MPFDGPANREKLKSARAALEYPKVAELLGDDYTPELKIAFPDIAPPVYPVGTMIMCQLRNAMRKTKGGIWLPDETRDLEKYRTQTALVRACGPAAFKRRDNGDDWPEGDWAIPGQFVRIPLYGGDRIAVKYKEDDKDFEALFISIKDMDILGITIGDPLSVKAEV